jgi:phage terminase large subunit
MARFDIPASSEQRRLIEFILNPKEPHTSAGYGGSRGPGKTWASTRGMVYAAMRYPRSLGIMLRRVLLAADLNLGEEVRAAIREVGLEVSNKGTVGVRYRSDTHVFTFPNGSRIQMGYCRNPNDWEQYQGVEYTWIAFEEATQFPERAWELIGASNRVARGVEGGARAKRWVTCNPGGIGHEWVYRRFIDEKTRDRGALWIPCRMRDALPVLEHDPGYALRVLRTLPETQRRQWEEGDWEAVEGAYWTLDDVSVRDVEVPPWATMCAGVDAGYWPSAFAVVWVAMWQTERGDLRLHVVADLKRYRLNLAEQAEATLWMEQERELPVKVRYADPACWKRIESETGAGQSTAIIWHQNGLNVLPAVSNARVAGWQALRTMLGNGVLTIAPTCRNLLMEMRSALHDPKSDDMMPGSDDHVQDALRYVVLSVVGTKGTKATRLSKTEARRRWIEKMRRATAPVVVRVQ